MTHKTSIVAFAIAATVFAFAVPAHGQKSPDIAPAAEIGEPAVPARARRGRPAVVQAGMPRVLRGPSVPLYTDRERIYVVNQGPQLKAPDYDPYAVGMFGYAIGGGYSFAPHRFHYRHHGAHRHHAHRRLGFSRHHPHRHGAQRHDRHAHGKPHVHGGARPHSMHPRPR